MVMKLIARCGHTQFWKSNYNCKYGFAAYSLGKETAVEGKTETELSARYL